MPGVQRDQSTEGGGGGDGSTGAGQGFTEGSDCIGSPRRQRQRHTMDCTAGSAGAAAAAAVCNMHFVDSEGWGHEGQHPSAQCDEAASLRAHLAHGRARQADDEGDGHEQGPHAAAAANEPGRALARMCEM